MPCAQLFPYRQAAYPLVDEFWVQWPQLLDACGPKAKYHGGGDMIFVTVGTHHQGFDRLVQAADELAADIDEQVVIQRGVTELCPQACRHFKFCSMQEMADWIQQARVVVAQAGAGTIITTLQQGKCW